MTHVVGHVEHYAGDQMYKEFGTIEEEYFYDRLEDGKYDEGFKERQVKEKKSR